MPAPTLRRVALRLRRAAAPHQHDLPPGRSISLASLRSRLDPASRKTRWTIHPDGVLGRALICEADAASTVPLRLAGGVAFVARAMLLPHDWRDRHGTVRAWVAVTDAQARQQELWGGELEASDRSRPRGHAVSVQIPADSTALTLGVTSVHAPDASPLRRAIFLDPTIIDPNASHDTAPRAADHPTAALPRADHPLISVLVPVHDPPLHMLEEAIASVHAQTFPNWELCLVDDGSTRPEIIAALTHHAGADPRIHLSRHDDAQGISAATNAALEIATGQYIALLDHDDTLTPDALQHVADQIAAQPELDMIYTDEDVVADDGSFKRHIKPGWSPEHMSAAMYTCHLAVFRRSLVGELGGFDSRFDGCQDYDFVLRLMERTDRIAHIPRILYHWRAHAISTAGGDAKPFAYLAQPGAIGAHLERTGVDAGVQFGHYSGLHRIVHRVDASTTVDLVLAAADPTGLAEAAGSWLAQPHPSWNVVLASPAEILDAAIAELTSAGIPQSRITALPAPAGDPAAALSTAAAAATAEHLLLMQTPAMGLTHDWLTRLLGYSAQPGVAAAGPILLARDGRIEQAGIALPEGIPLHLRNGDHAAVAQPVVYNVTAVSGMLATSRDAYHRIGGLDPQFRELALIDYCLRATGAGQRVVLVPDARLRTTGPDLTTNDLATIWRLRDAWAETNTHDPYYNLNYRADRGDFVLRRY
jgi:GT2 family glycosyltransferase